MNYKSYTMDLAGKPLTLEFGKYCEQAAGSVWVHLGDTVVMVNATMSPEPRPGVDFFPLAVDVEEKQYSVGKIPGGFIKREGRPTEKATLTCRLIDRPLRPLFPKGMRNDVQVVATGPVRGQGDSPGNPRHDRFLRCAGRQRHSVGRPHRLGRGGLGSTANMSSTPTLLERASSSTCTSPSAAPSDAVLMVEAGAKEVSEDVMLDAILFAHEEIKKICRLRGSASRPRSASPKRPYVPLITAGRRREGRRARIRSMTSARGCSKPSTVTERSRREAQVKAESAGALCEKPSRAARARSATRCTAIEQGSHARKDPGARACAPTAASSDRGAPDLVRGGRAAPRAWLRRVHPRPNPGR